MIKQKRGKSIEELYGNNKFERSKTQPGLYTGNISGLKTGRITGRDYGYLISTTSPYTAAAAAANSNKNTKQTGGITTRRKSTRPNEPSAKSEKLEDIKKEKSNSCRVKTMRCTEKCPYNSCVNLCENKSHNNAGVFTEKSKDAHSLGENTMPRHHHHHHHHHGHNYRTSRSHEDDKDDDTEEFFELIRQTVESAVGKSVSDIVNRNSRELGVKIDKLLSELKHTNVLLNKIQTDINNKIVHYGEENSRHFRYLCMKSEYDKMFYQHQSMIANRKVPNTNTIEKQSNPLNDLPPEVTMPACNVNVSATGEGEKVAMPSTTTTTTTTCQCCNNIAKELISHNETKDTQKVEDHTVSTKNSDMCLRDMLDQIQRFCAQMQVHETVKCETNETRPPVPVNVTKSRSKCRYNEALKMNKLMYEDEDDEDDDELDLSSDGMTPRSDDNSPTCKYETKTVRSGGPKPPRHSGAGDA